MKTFRTVMITVAISISTIVIGAMIANYFGGESGGDSVQSSIIFGATILSVLFIALAYGVYRHFKKRRPKKKTRNGSLRNQIALGALIASIVIMSVIGVGYALNGNNPVTTDAGTETGSTSQNETTPTQSSAQQQPSDEQTSSPQPQPRPTPAPRTYTSSYTPSPTYQAPTPTYTYTPTTTPTADPPSTTQTKPKMTASQAASNCSARGVPSNSSAWQQCINAYLSQY